MTPPNSGNFTVSQKVCCVDAAGIGLCKPLVEGAVYVVRGAGTDDSRQAGVYLVGITNPVHERTGREHGYYSVRFRSLDELKAESKLKSVVKQFIKEKANL